jgi:hypothetical protein
MYFIKEGLREGGNIREAQGSQIIEDEKYLEFLSEPLE